MCYFGLKVRFFKFVGSKIFTTLSVNECILKDELKLIGVARVDSVLCENYHQQLWTT